jgi:hypothetical protein
MGTAQVAFAEVLWGATGSDVIGSDVTGSDMIGSHVTGSDVSNMTGNDPVRKYILRRRNRKLRHIRPSGAFWPEVTSVTWLEEALSGSGPDRK